MIMKKVIALSMLLFAFFCAPVLADAEYPIETEVFEWDTFGFDAPAGWEKDDSDLDIFYSFYYYHPDMRNYISVTCYSILQQDHVTSHDIIDDDFTDEDLDASDYRGKVHYRYDDVETYFSGRYPICFGSCIETEEYDGGEFVQTYYKIVFYDKDGYKAEIDYYYDGEPDDDILSYFKMIPDNIVLK